MSKAAKTTAPTTAPVQDKAVKFTEILKHAKTIYKKGEETWQDAIRRATLELQKKHK